MVILILKGSKMLDRNQLRKLTTKRLMTLYRKKFKSMKSCYAYITDYGAMPEILNNNNDSDEVQYCIRLDKYCDLMKSILDTREHIND